MRDIVLRHIMRDALLEGAEDPISLSGLALSVLEGLGIAPSAARRVTVGLLQVLLERGLISLGDLRPDGSFEKWWTEVDDTVRRIENLWPIGQPAPELSGEAWIETTENGKEWVERYLVLLGELPLPRDLLNE